MLIAKARPACQELEQDNLDIAIIKVIIATLTGVLCPV